ncbi:myotubularin-related protein 6-like isoform X2 [Pomacea canaliculata]|uniref:myotubularin-related protein 6-like isoform X2 n=1 Tax=Pomacea canaliculata TaxID=400727 RepID=UPI000D72749E|nr:myotubularin-related protein 6-like isoform X2 [Pomacea canaliculata]
MPWLKRRRRLKLKKGRRVSEVVENVKLQDRVSTRQPSVGTLYLTATHLIFVDNEGKKESWIQHMHIAQVEKQPLYPGGSPLQIRCKNFMCVTFVLPRERDCHDIYTTLQELSRPGSIENLYAFHFTATESWEKSFGWGMFDIQSEYLRMGCPSEHWTHSHLNRNYELCDTYPSLLYVPTLATTPMLVGSSKFRSRGRLPVLSYLHRENQAAVTRCSQPLSGFSARCLEDEQLLDAVLRSNPKSSFMYVVDTRPKINAMINKAQGKGYENESCYANMKFQFLGIENIHIMRSSLQKLVEVCELKNPSMSGFLSGLENSGFLKHIAAILETSVFIANAISEGTSVLVHCSDGWDRTAQVCSLASLLLDPYYRTVPGFMALIEKEWLSFGHKFTDRCGYLDSVDAKEVSPVFAQFLDCVWQLMQQFPCCFQFNERFLLTIFDHAYSCQFGTFIGNCEKDRLDLRLSERTYSLWGYIHRHVREYVNPLYKKDHEVTSAILKPNIAPQSIKFWRGMYNRFENGIHPRENIMDILATTVDHTLSMMEHIEQLEMRIKQLCKLLNKPEEVVQRKLQGFLSVESLSDMATGPPEDSLSCLTLNSNTTNSLEVDLMLNGRFPQEIGFSHGRSDSESGFDESGSQLSRSGFEETTCENNVSITHSPSTETLTDDFLDLEMKSVAVEWKSFRSVFTCSCAIPFDYYVKKFHCWRCGEVFCTRCISTNTGLPGHHSRRAVPVCKPCFKMLRHSPSIDFPPS